MNITPYKMAQRFIGREEVAGSVNDPQIMEWLKLDHEWPSGDEVPWCSAFVNWICWMMWLPRSKSLAARSWLWVGEPVPYHINAKRGFDIVVLKRGPHPQPGPDVIYKNDRLPKGHVGFYSNSKNGVVHVLGGNQGNRVSIQAYDERNILGIRRLDWKS